MMLGGVFYEIYGTRDVVECHKSCKAQSHQIKWFIVAL